MSTLLGLFLFFIGMLCCFCLLVVMGLIRRRRLLREVAMGARQSKVKVSVRENVVAVVRRGEIDARTH